MADQKNREYSPRGMTGTLLDRAGMFSRNIRAGWFKKGGMPKDLRSPPTWWERYRWLLLGMVVGTMLGIAAAMQFMGRS